MHRLILAISLCFAALTATAQSQFSPAILVNDEVITNYELTQRTRFLELVRVPGDPAEVAREQLINERLQLQEIRRVGIEIPPEEITDGIDEFAGRANLTGDQFIEILASAGIESGTLRDFVTAGIGWRTYVRGRFGADARVEDREIDDAVSTSGGAGRGSIRVLISEIIIAAPPPRAAAARAEADRISQLTSIDAFSAAARRVSALPSRARGGRLDWQPLTDLPPAIQPLILQLDRGEVTDPLPIQNGVALFQLRDIEEIDAPAPEFGAIDFVELALATSPSQAASLVARADTCDDLYGLVPNASEEQLRREILPPAQIQTDIALQLSQLDPGEISFALGAPEGTTRLVMLCGRTPVLDEGEEINREAIRNQLVSRRLGGLADAFLAELRADASIREP